MSDMLILALVATPLLVQNIVLMIQVNKLTNKVMSKNYGEYVQAQAQAKPQDGIEIKIPQDLPDTDINVMQEYIS